ncbi:MAG: hypothetical protein SF028_06915, partial [Candidatus Sumerlaeia bacterium]|nr:hypothetical protein [Candidatus Sumerlaeia bacterium]
MIDAAARFNGKATPEATPRRAAPTAFPPPPWIEWLANIDNPRTRRAYRIDVADLIAFLGIEGGTEFRQVTRAHM